MRWDCLLRSGSAGSESLLVVGGSCSTSGSVCEVSICDLHVRDGTDIPLATPARSPILDAIRPDLVLAGDVDFLAEHLILIDLL